MPTQSVWIEGRSLGFRERVMQFTLWFQPGRNQAPAYLRRAFIAGTGGTERVAQNRLAVSARIWCEAESAAGGDRVSLIVGTMVGRDGLEPSTIGLKVRKQLFYGSLQGFREPISREKHGKNFNAALYRPLLFLSYLYYNRPTKYNFPGTKTSL